MWKGCLGDELLGWTQRDGHWDVTVSLSVENLGPLLGCSSGPAQNTARALLGLGLSSRHGNNLNGRRQMNG